MNIFKFHLLDIIYFDLHGTQKENKSFEKELERSQLISRELISDYLEVLNQGPSRNTSKEAHSQRNPITQTEAKLQNKTRKHLTLHNEDHSIPGYSDSQTHEICVSRNHANMSDTDALIKKKLSSSLLERKKSVKKMVAQIIKQKQHQQNKLKRIQKNSIREAAQHKQISRNILSGG